MDGVWLSVGTMNFDNRSLALNDEAPRWAPSRAEQSLLPNLAPNAVAPGQSRAVSAAHPFNLRESVR